MKNKKIIALAAGAMAAVALIGGTLAYLTSSDNVTNTFTVGNVEIQTVEPNWPGNGDEEVTNVTPNKEIPKDPQIKNVGENDAVMFMHVDIPLQHDLITAQDDGTRNAAGDVELVKYRKTGGTYNSINTGWEELATTYIDANGDVADQADATAVRRLYGYNQKVAKDAQTVPVFDQIKIANVIEGQIDNSTQNIKITSYGIQADNITDISTAGTMSADTLKSVWNVYYNQNEASLPDSAAPQTSSTPEPTPEP